MAKVRPLAPYHGFLVIDKALHMTSNDVVMKARKHTRIKKIGHAGTLDPLASGVLPLAIGEATKCIHLLMDATKTYRFRITFGESRTTDDAEGEVVHSNAVRPDSNGINSVLASFIGTILQKPPIYSALKVNGQRAYDLARAGEVFELEARPITIHSLELVGMTGPNEAELLATVGKGTYIRSLARDIAEKLGAYGYVSYLRRESVGPFTAEHAISLDFLAEQVHNAEAFGKPQWLTPLRTLLDGIPACDVSAEELASLRKGQALRRSVPPCETLAIMHHDELVALGISTGDNVKPTRILHTLPTDARED